MRMMIDNRLIRAPLWKTICAWSTHGLSVLMVCVSLVLATEVFSADPIPTDELAEYQHAQMLALFENVDLTIGGEASRMATRSPQPALKYTNPANSSQVYAAMFLWLEDKVPVAVMCPSFRDSGKIFWEWTSLSAAPLALTRHGKTVWEPHSAGHTSQELPDAPAPAGTPAGRLVQMRALARRFAVTEQRRGSPHEARLMTQPFYRWENPTGGVVDAGMFGFAETTDPEVLLIFEARQITGSKQQTWYYTVARMTSASLTVRLDEQPVWLVEDYWQHPRTRQDPYFETTIGTFDPETFFPKLP